MLYCCDLAVVPIGLPDSKTTCSKHQTREEDLGGDCGLYEGHGCAMITFLWVGWERRGTQVTLISRVLV